MSALGTPFRSTSLALMLSAATLAPAVTRAAEPTAEPSRTPHPFLLPSHPRPPLACPPSDWSLPLRWSGLFGPSEGSKSRPPPSGGVGGVGGLFPLL